MSTDMTSHKPRNACCLATVQNKKCCGLRRLDLTHQAVLRECKRCSFL